MKICSRCKVEKTLDNFTKNKTTKDGFKNHCKNCVKEYMEINKEHIKKYNKQWRKDNEQKVKEYADKWYEENKESVSEHGKEYYKNNKDRKNSYRKSWGENNKERLLEYRRRYRESNREYFCNYNKEYTKNRFETDPIFKLSCNTRNLILTSFKRSCEGKYKKSDKTEVILGCTILEFIEHLQSLFTEGMTLENHGSCEECWHIDHKIPLASARTEEEIIKLSHYTNLQPLWRFDNLSKGSKI